MDEALIEAIEADIARYTNKPLHFDEVHEANAAVLLPGLRRALQLVRDHQAQQPQPSDCAICGPNCEHKPGGLYHPSAAKGREHD